MSEIDELGSSLLNRQRANVDRTDKRLRRNVRNQAALALASKGVQLVNSALKNRADTFVNQNEDLIGQRVLYKSALGDRQAILDDYAAGQAYAGGMEEYLTSKFLPDTTQAITLNVDDEVYTADSIGKLALVKAREAAKAYQPQFETAYKAALNMPELDDYDAFVATQTRGKKATNVGNFLVNSVLRNINEQTPEDTDKQIVDAVLNSRFGENAKAVKRAKSLMDQGYSTTKAARITEEIEQFEKDLETKKTKVVSIETIDRTVPLFGVDTIIPTQVTTMERPDGALIKTTGPVYEIDPTTGNLKKDPTTGNNILSKESAKNYLLLQAYERGVNPSELTNLDDDALKLSKAANSNNLDIRSQPVGTPTKTTRGVYAIKGNETRVEHRNIGGQLVAQTFEFTPTEDLTRSEKLSRIPDDLTAKAKSEILRSFAQSTTGVTIFGGRKNALVDEVLAIAYTGDIDSIEELTDANREEAITAMVDPLYKETAVTAQELIEKLNIDMDTAYQLAGATVVESITSGMNESFDKFRPDGNFLSVDKFKNSLMLMADARIQQERPGVALEIDDTAYDQMILDSIKEIRPLKDKSGVDISDINATNKKEARQKLKNSFIASDTTVNLTNQPEIREQLALTHNIDEITSETGEVRVFHILEHFDRLEGQEDITPSNTAKPPSDVETPPINIENYRGTNRVAENDVITPILRRISDTFKNIDERSEAQQELVKLRNSYIEEGLNANPPLSRTEATIYADDMMKSRGSNIPK